MSFPEPLLDRLRGRLAETQRSARLPSLSAAAIRRGQDRWVAGIGDPEPVAALQYRIGSISKTFTAVLVMQLRDEGRLRLDDELSRYLPATPVGHLLIRDLLGHLSGLRREPLGDFWEAGPGHPADELLADLRTDDLLLPSRRAWHYSNLAYGLLGQVVERLRQAPYADTLLHRLLEPLGLTRTTYLPEPPHAVGLRVHPFADTVVEEPVHDTLAMAPAGQLWSTPADLCRWGEFLADAAEDILAAATVEEMAEPVVMADPDRWTTGYGLGLQLLRRGDRVLVGHGGSMPGFGAGLAVSRREGVAAAVCANAWGALDGAALACDLVVDVLDRDPQPPTPWGPSDVPPEVADLLGIWWWRGLQFVASVSDGAFFLGPAVDPRGPRAVRFEPVGVGLFVGMDGMNRGERLQVVRDGAGRATHLDVGTWVFAREFDARKADTTPRGPATC